MNFKEVYQTVLKDYPEIMSVEETSAALGVSTKTVYKMLKNGTIQNMKVGRLPCSEGTSAFFFENQYGKGIK